MSVNEIKFNQEDYPKIQEGLTHPRKRGWLVRHVEWIRKPRDSTVKKIAVRALGILEGIAACLLFIGIPFVYAAAKLSSRMDKKKEFDQSIKEAPIIDTPPLFSPKATFNHLSHFMIDNEGIIWTKPLKGNAPWKALYFDGENPVEIKADYSDS